MVLTIGAALLLSGFLWWGSGDVARLLLPSGYMHVAGRAWLYSLGICGYLFASGIVSLAIVRGDPVILVSTVTATIFQFVLFRYRHETLEQILVNQILVFGFLGTATLVHLLIRFRSSSAA